METIFALIGDEVAARAIEYELIAGAIRLGIVAMLESVANALNGILTSAADILGQG